MPGDVGTVLMTAGGTVLAKATAVRVYDVHVIGSATGASIELREGSTTGRLILDIDGESTKNVSESFSEGILFNGGCYLVTAANFISAAITCEAEF